MAKPFKFSLEVLKKYRDQKVLLAKRELAQLQGELADVEDKINSLRGGRRDTLSSCFSDSGKSTGAILSFETFIVSGSTSKIGILEEKKIFLTQEVDKHLEWVAHLSKELKAVEKLEEKQRGRYDEKNKLDEKRADEAWIAENWNRFKERREA